jgi:hypothetical protein
MANARDALVDRLMATGLAHLPGGVLYSGLSTLKPGTGYAIGYNPGGEPDHQPAPILSHLLSATAATRNEYLDAAWETRTYSYPAGKAPLQRRVCYLLDGLGLPIRSVCASNLIFVRSKSGAHLATPRDLAERCWPVHRLILDIVQPACIVSFDKKVWDFICAHGTLLVTPELIPAGHGNWSCGYTRIAIDNRQMNLISLPHLSRYAIDRHPEVVHWAQQRLTLV